MTLRTNIDWWQKIVEKPTIEFQELFDIERKFLLTNIPENSYVLDVGCGKGRNIETIIKRTRSIVGVDNDPIAVQDADFRFRTCMNVDVIHREIDDLRLRSSSFDVVTHMILLPNLGHKKQASFIEISKVLRKGGKLLLSAYAETALEVRIATYESVGVPIKYVDGASGAITLDLSAGEVISEQFTLEQLEELGQKAGLTMIGHQKVGDLAYLVVFEK